VLFVLKFGENLSMCQCVYVAYKLKCSHRITLFNFHNIDTQIWTLKKKIKFQINKSEWKWTSGHVHTNKSQWWTFNDCLFSKYWGIFEEYSICKLEKMIKTILSLKNMLHYTIMYRSILKISSKMYFIFKSFKSSLSNDKH
jgi:hypothetical protein